MTQEPLDLRPPEQRRDEGFARLEDSHSEWLIAAVKLIRWQAVKHPEITSDEVRTAATDTKLPAPKHKNAWGAAFNMARKLGYIAPTDRIRKSTRDKAHSHANRVWQRGPNA